VVDRCARRSVWVVSDSERYKAAYVRFWREHFQLNADPEIPGKFWHVDHAFNRARVRAGLLGRLEQFLGVKSNTYDPEPALCGYVRLYLVEAAVNVAWGGGVERRRTAERNEIVRGLPASHLILAKLAGLQPPRSRQALRDVTVKLKELYGLDSIATDDLFYLVGHDMRQDTGAKAVSVIASIDGLSLEVWNEHNEVVHRSDGSTLVRFIHSLDDLVDYACSEGAGLDRPFSPAEMGAVRRVLVEECAIFSAFVHHAMRWPVVRIDHWFGIEAPDGKMYDARGPKTLDQVMLEYGTAEGALVEKGGWPLVESRLFIPDNPYAPFASFWMCQRVLECLPRQPFQQIRDFLPDDEAIVSNGLATPDGYMIRWWQS
jgi:hypothetical protein